MRRALRRAFTLIELMGVLLLIGLLVAAVSVSLGSADRTARMEDVVEQVVQADRLARAEAKRAGRGNRIVYSLRESRIQREGVSANARHVADGVTLPPGYSVGEVRVSARRGVFGEQRVLVSSGGASEAYAVRVDGPEERRKWVYFAGLTGEAVVIDDAREIEAMFRAFAGPSSGADAR